MNLSEIVPLDLIAQALDQPLVAERLHTADVGEALGRKPDDVFGIAAWTWHRIVTSGRTGLDSKHLRHYFDGRDPSLARAIEAVIGQPLFRELGSLTATVHHAGEPFVVATSCAVHLYCDELHLYDIGLADPRHPLSRRERKSGTQYHRGFGLLAVVMRNLFDAARERRCPVVTLTAANALLVDVFARHGFEVEQSAFAEEALAFGLGIPMQARV